LYSSNLSNDTNEVELNHHFSTAGKVISVVIVRGRYSRPSRGMSLIKMETEGGMRQAVNRFNGIQLEDNIIAVS
jgi:RNA recognition motif-containing protein